MDTRLTRLELKTLLIVLADFFAPRECAVCGRPLLACEKHLCLECLADLPLTYFWDMPHNRMADRFNALVPARAYVRAAALFYYSEDYGRITRALKYGRNFAIGRYYARELGRRLAAAGWQVDAVCPVPLHWTRRYRRGYNQAGIIASELATALGARYVPSLLRRTRRTRTQTRLGESLRAANVAGAFVACPEITPLRSAPVGMTEARSAPVGMTKVVLLVDDVFTTGSTLAACYRALWEAYGGQVRICVATLAYVE